MAERTRADDQKTDRPIIVFLCVFGLIMAIGIVIIALSAPAPAGTTYPDPTLTPPSATAPGRTTTP